MKHKAQFGTISHGTMRTKDLIPAFANELEYLAGDEAGFDVLISRANALLMDEDGNYYLNEDDAQEVLNYLFDALNSLAPSYAYFGSHSGDGSDYGFWLSEDLVQEFDGLKVSDTSEVPEDFSGEVLHVNDHGNATLYAANAGILTEIWAVV